MDENGISMMWKYSMLIFLSLIYCSRLFLAIFVGVTTVCKQKYGSDCRLYYSSNDVIILTLPLSGLLSRACSITSALTSFNAT